ncbi:MAG: T9SS type A sorting domain-containing protein [Crocinitomicaceae bacterium]
MKNFISCLLVIISFQGISQIEKELPLLGNQELMSRSNHVGELKSNGGTFDSTFMYTTDTLQLPFFDEFSKNKFQQYNAQFSDPGITFDKKYALLDLANVPLPTGSIYSLNATYHRYVNVANGTYTDTLFPSIDINVGSLNSYPVTYNSTPAFPAFIIIDTIDFPNSEDTIFVFDNTVGQDSATQFFKQIDDPKALWLDHRAYHNYRFAVKPWTIGVVTFDGIDDHGYPYSFGATGSDYADALTSKPLDLSVNSAGDSIYLSFLYQRQGFGEEPEAGDSLTLQFFNPTTNTWNRVWGVGGGTVADFRVVHLPLTNPDYFANGFQMRFRNYGSLAGGLDHFHLDYVTFRTGSYYSDTLFKDFAFSYPTGSLLKDYTSVPWDHYKNNFAGKMNDQTEIVVRNGSNTAENNLDGSVEVRYAGITEGNFILPAQTLSGGDINYGPRTTYFSYHDFSAGYHFDETKFGTKQKFDIVSAATAQFSDSTMNDTTYTEQYFANYYAYDDGTAERAYSFNVAQGRLAVRFNPYEADSVIGAYVNFVPAVYDAENELFVLTVWEDNSGVPGSVIYEDNLFYPKSPQYEYNNTFVPYYFDDTTRVRVNGSFFIGFRQFDATPLNIGLDKNTDHSANNYYSMNGGNTWINSSISGSLMIRPIFSTAMDAELGVKELIQENIDFVLYPNPTQNTFKIKASKELSVSGMTIFNLQGQPILETEENEMDLSDFQAGVYLVRPNGSNQTLRVIKK